MSRRRSAAIVTAILAAIVAIAPNQIAAAASAPPVYPGAVATTRPAGVAMKTPPAQAKTYVTADSFAKVKAWYRAHLKGAQEAQQPGMEKTEDAFLVGTAESAMVVLVQSYKGKTYIVIGPPM